MGVTPDTHSRFVAWARRGDRPPVAEVLSQEREDIEDQGLAAEYLVDLALELSAADQLEAVSHAREAVQLSREANALVADFWPVWMYASELIHYHGDRRVLAETLAFVEDPGIPWPAGIRAQRARLQAFVGEDGSLSDAAVEGLYREALSTARSWGSVVHEAHVQADLGCWLIRQGRDDEGAELVAAARGCYEGLGATRWLESLERRAGAQAS
jgi:hypothetical protein